MGLPSVAELFDEVKVLAQLPGGTLEEFWAV
jgi:hypothetical protein